MSQDSELLTRVRQSLRGVTLSAPLEATVRRGRKLRARRRMAVISAAVISAATVITIVTALAVTGPGGSRRPGAQLAAWTVIRQPHGVIVVQISQLRDPAGLQRALRADGVPATVAFQHGAPTLDPPIPRECRATGLSAKADALLQEKILDQTPPPAGTETLPAPMSAGVDGRPAIALTIRPAAIPKGIGLNLTVQSSDNSWGWGLGLVRASPQCTGS